MLEMLKLTLNRLTHKYLYEFSVGFLTITLACLCFSSCHLRCLQFVTKLLKWIRLVWDIQEGEAGEERLPS